MSAPTPNPMPDNIDYSHTSNVARLHAAAAREKGEPVAKSTPISLGIVAGLIAVTLIAGNYYGKNSGGDFAGANIKGYFYPLKFDTPGQVGGGEMDPIEAHQPANWIAAGKSVYSNAGTCASCHRPTGEGEAGKYPPLKDSEFVIKGERRLVAILLHGIVGSLTVNGKPFNDQMQPLGTTALNDKQLAQLLSYIRNDWGNQGSILYEDQIKVLRKELGGRAPYNEAELRAIPEDANAPASEWPAKLKASAAPAAAGTTAPGAPAAAPAPGTPPAAPGTPAETPPAPPPAK